MGSRRLLASRVIPVVLYRGYEAVKGSGFNSWRSVGQVRQAARVYERRNVDEILFLDVAATPNNREPDFALIKDMVGEVFAPVTVGGGIRFLPHACQLIANGADKVALGTAAVEDPCLIGAIAAKFGRQAVVVSIDVKDGQVVTHCGKRPIELDPVRWARECEAKGAGELLVNAVDRDGTLTGYDLELVRSISEAVNIPVIACGGAGTYEHMKQALDVGAHAVAASAIWAFTDSTPAGAADYLARHGIPTRRKIAA
jgi:cyclase